MFYFNGSIVFVYQDIQKHELLARFKQISYSKESDVSVASVSEEITLDLKLPKGSPIFDSVHQDSSKYQVRSTGDEFLTFVYRDVPKSYIFVCRLALPNGRSGEEQ